jgi:hypothetical protein
MGLILSCLPSDGNDGKILLQRAPRADIACFSRNPFDQSGVVEFPKGVQFMPDYILIATDTLETRVVSLEEAAAIIELYADEIEWAIEEFGRCDTDR